jgi:hypothetical protein
MCNSQKAPFKHFTGQPMARFTNLRLAVADRGRQITAIQAGVPTMLFF